MASVYFCCIIDFILAYLTSLSRLDGKHVQMCALVLKKWYSKICVFHSEFV